MKIRIVIKTHLNDKWCDFSDGIIFLPFVHLLLSDLRELKKYFPEIHTVIEKENKLLKMENQAVTKNERLRVLRSIYAQPITHYKLSSKTKENQKGLILQQLKIIFWIQSGYNLTKYKITSTMMLFTGIS